MRIIPTDALRNSDLPDPGASWDGIVDFARTFNGYEWAGDALKCGDLANSTKQEYERSPSHRVPSRTLDELRACLFFAWRASAHAGEEPRGPTLLYIQALVESIREGLLARDAGDPNTVP
jgi:hypothetical protein